MTLHNTPDSSEANVVQYRIERGAEAVGADGPLGTVEQIVVDRDSGELRALIIRSRDGGSEFELPAEHVQRATGDHVYLDVGRADIAREPELATPYDPSQYVPVYQGETASPGEASRTAVDTEHPVVTEVEDNAAEIVAPQTVPEPVTSEMTTAPSDATTTPTDTATGTATTWMPRDNTVQAMPSNGAALTDEATTPLQSTPAKSASATPSTTGTLIGGKPSTSGMGEKSSVPRSDEPPYDETPTPPGTQYAAPAPGMVEDFREAGSEPGAIPDEDLQIEDTTPTMPLRRGDLIASAPSTTSTLADDDVTDLGPAPISAATAPIETTMPTPAPLRDTTTNYNALPETEIHFERAPLSEMLPMPVLIALGVLAAGAAGGILLARRQRNTNQVKSTARKAAGTLQDLLGSAGDNAADASKAAQQAAKTTKRNAKRAARRGSWFVRGLLAGAGAAVLYAPDSGEHLRLQLNSAANRLLRRAS